MPLELALCDDGDMDRAFAIISDGFGEEHPYFNYVFPKHNTVTGRKVGGERFRAMKQGDPTASYIKITDNTTGVIIAVTKWNIYDGKIPEEVTVEGDFWDSEIEKQLAQEMFSGYLLPRRQAIKAANGRIICTSNALQMDSNAYQIFNRFGHDGRRSKISEERGRKDADPLGN